MYESRYENTVVCGVLFTPRSIDIYDIQELNDCDLNVVRYRGSEGLLEIPDIEIISKESAYDY